MKKQITKIQDDLCLHKKIINPRGLISYSSHDIFCQLISHDILIFKFVT
jgi:hypothetical protein